MLLKGKDIFVRAITVSGIREIRCQDGVVDFLVNFPSCSGTIFNGSVCLEGYLMALAKG